MNFHHAAMNLCDPKAVFDRLPLDELQLHEPRTGCAPRAQRIIEWLDAKGFITGRIWALSRKGQSVFFDAPIRDGGGNRLAAFAVAEDRETPSHQVWNYHVAATAEGENDKIIFDPAFYDGPVAKKTWESLFCPEQTYILALKATEPPLYSWQGSYYSPELTDQFCLEPKDCARIDLASLAALRQNPAYIAPCYRPHPSAAIKDRLLKKHF